MTRPCGEQHPSRFGVLCTLNPWHVSDHCDAKAGVHWHKETTLPDVAAVRRPSRCYYCQRPSTRVENVDVAVCDAHCAKRSGS